ncbi:MAG: MYXO-CTERM sorting domain-containing protein [Myxococcales bacterium]|nr:MYXO-CTERM sorting domain-containing protein [Myxococcales bacterium]
MRASVGAAIGVLTLAVAGCEPPEGDDIVERAAALAHEGRWAIPGDVLAEAAQSRVPITDAGPWRGEASCSGTFTVGARRLGDWIEVHFPQVTGVGGYSCRSINGNNNVTSIHAVGRALDVFIPLDGGQADNDLGDELANYLLVNAQYIGIQRVIWDRTYWRSGDAPREGYYDGAHPHHDHLHVELSVAAGNQQTPFFTDGLPAPDRGPCAPPLGVEGGVIDDDGPCFVPYGPAQYWRSVGGEGHGGGLLWTNAFQNDTPSNWGQWRFEVAAAGTYTVEVHTVAAYSLHDAVRYAVQHAGGSAERVVDLAGKTGWTALGDFRFEPGNAYSVSMFDNVPGAIGSDVHITADAVRLRAEAPPPPPPRMDAAPPPPPPRDAGAPPPPPPEDAGAPPPPARDAFVPPPARDAFVPPPVGDDAEPPPFQDDDPMPGVDAGLGGPADDETRAVSSKQSGGCDTTPDAPAPAWWGLLGLLGLWVRRRR